jgi:hypothetical protein
VSEKLTSKQIQGDTMTSNQQQPSGSKPARQYTRRHYSRAFKTIAAMAVAICAALTTAGIASCVGPTESEADILETSLLSVAALQADKTVGLKDAVSNDGEINVRRKGAVQIVRGGLPGCSGALISPKFVLTSASCFPDLLDSTGGATGLWLKLGVFRGNVRYFDPTPPSGMSSPYNLTRVLDQYEELIVFFHGDFLGLAQGDLGRNMALVMRSNGQPWLHTTSNDYLYLNSGTCNQIVSGNMYGAGCTSSDCSSGRSKLHTMPYYLVGCTSNYFVHTPPSQAACSGDEGGPYVKQVQDSFGTYQTVTGIYGYSWPTTNISPGNCGIPAGGLQLGTRLDPNNTAWIKSMVTAVGGQCTSLQSTNGIPVHKCF